MKEVSSRVFHWFQEYWAFVLAAVTYFAACWLSYQIEYVWFDEAVHTPFFSLLVWPLGLLLGRIVRYQQEEKEVTPWQDKLPSLLNWILLGISFVLLSWGMFRWPYDLTFYCFFSLLVLLSIYTWFQKHPPKKEIRHPGALIFAAGYGLCILTSLVYLLILHPCTVNGARQQLEGLGYTDTITAVLPCGS